MTSSPSPAVATAFFDFCTAVELPADPAIRGAVIDAELATFAAMGGSASSAWVVTLNAARADVSRQQRVRDLAGEGFGALPALRRAGPGNVRLRLA